MEGGGGLGGWRAAGGGGRDVNICELTIPELRIAVPGTARSENTPKMYGYRWRTKKIKSRTKSK